jgi:hypothetical protein
MSALSSPNLKRDHLDFLMECHSVLERPLEVLIHELLECKLGLGERCGCFMKNKVKRAFYIKHIHTMIKYYGREFLSSVPEDEFSYISIDCEGTSLSLEWTSLSLDSDTIRNFSYKKSALLFNQGLDRLGIVDRLHIRVGGRLGVVVENDRVNGRLDYLKDKLNKLDNTNCHFQTIRNLQEISEDEKFKSIVDFFSDSEPYLRIENDLVKFISECEVTSELLDFFRNKKEVLTQCDPWVIFYLNKVDLRNLNIVLNFFHKNFRLIDYDHLSTASVTKIKGRVYHRKIFTTIASIHPDLIKILDQEKPKQFCLKKYFSEFFNEVGELKSAENVVSELELTTKIDLYKKSLDIVYNLLNLLNRVDASKVDPVAVKYLLHLGELDLERLKYLLNKFSPNLNEISPDLNKISPDLNEISPEKLTLLDGDIVKILCEKSPYERFTKVLDTFDNAKYPLSGIDPDVIKLFLLTDDEEKLNLILNEVKEKNALLSPMSLKYLFAIGYFNQKSEEDSHQNAQLKEELAQTYKRLIQKLDKDNIPHERYDEIVNDSERKEAINSRFIQIIKKLETQIFTEKHEVVYLDKSLQDKKIYHIIKYLTTMKKDRFDRIMKDISSETLGSMYAGMLLYLMKINSGTFETIMKMEKDRRDILLLSNPDILEILYSKRDSRRSKDIIDKITIKIDQSNDELHPISKLHPDVIKYLYLMRDDIFDEVLRYVNIYEPQIKTLDYNHVPSIWEFIKNFSEMGKEVIVYRKHDINDKYEYKYAKNHNYHNHKLSIIDNNEPEDTGDWEICTDDDCIFGRENFEIYSPCFFAKDQSKIAPQYRGGSYAPISSIIVRYLSSTDIQDKHIIILDLLKGIQYSSKISSLLLHYIVRKEVFPVKIKDHHNWLMQSINGRLRTAVMDRTSYYNVIKDLIADHPKESVNQSQLASSFVGSRRPSGRINAYRIRTLLA